MLRLLITILLAAALIAFACAAIFADVVADPRPFFTYHSSVGFLTLYSDEPYDDADGKRVLADVAQRLAASPLNDLYPHEVYIANAPWRQKLFFAPARKAAGVNYYPLTNNVFLRRSDIGMDVVFGPSGHPAAPPRTLAYYAAHEITHSLTGERLGARNLWNFLLPQWVREGYADYVAFGGKADIDELYRRYQAGEPEFDYRKSGYYTRFRMLTAYMLEREHWTIDQLLDTRLSLDEAQAVMDRGMAAAAARAAAAEAAPLRKAEAPPMPPAVALKPVAPPPAVAQKPPPRHHHHHRRRRVRNTPESPPPGVPPPSNAIRD